MGIDMSDTLNINIRKLMNVGLRGMKVGGNWNSSPKGLNACPIVYTIGISMKKQSGSKIK